MIGFSLRSLWNRRFVAGLTVFAIALSAALIVGVEKLRDGARDSFVNSASGIDLVVAPRGNPVQILMAAVFGIGGTGTAMSWESFEWLENMPGVAWAVPIQMGDNHRGYPVIGTDVTYFEHVRHSGGQPLQLASGTLFIEGQADGAVLGAEVAARFGHAPGTVIVNAHGSGDVSFHMHDDAPFTVTGVLAPSGTAIDRMVIVSLAGFDAIHAPHGTPDADPLDAAGLAVPPRNTRADHETHEEHREHTGHDHDEGSRAAAGTGEHAHPRGRDPDGHAHAPERLNAVYVGLADRTGVLGLQRAVNDRAAEPLSAVLPAVALTELWGITGTAERALQIMAWTVALASIIGMVVMLSATLESRRREFAILRSVGASPAHVVRLILTEAAVLTGAGLFLGIGIFILAARVAGPVLASRFGVQLDTRGFDARELAVLASLFGAGLAAALVPAIKVYRATLADGLSVRI